MKKGYYRKDICILCDRKLYRGWKDPKVNIKVRGDLFGKLFESTIHKHCWQPFQALEGNSVDK